MLVISYGIPKSGSTLAFELVKRVLVSAGFEQEVLRNDRIDMPYRDPDRERNFVTGITKEKIEELISQFDPAKTIVVKTHSSFAKEIFAWLDDMQQRREVQVIASFRDPRDICLSLLDAGERSRRRNKGEAFMRATDLERAAALVRRHLPVFRRWASLRGTLRLNYDEVAFAPSTAIDRIERVLNVSCDRDDVLKYVFEEARTMKNKARRSRHVDELNDADKDMLAKTFDGFIRKVCESDGDRRFEKYRLKFLRS